MDQRHGQWEKKEEQDWSSWNVHLEKGGMDKMGGKAEKWKLTPTSWTLCLLMMSHWFMGITWKSSEDIHYHQGQKNMVAVQQLLKSCWLFSPTGWFMRVCTTRPKHYIKVLPGVCVLCLCCCASQMARPMGSRNNAAANFSHLIQNFLTKHNVPLVHEVPCSPGIASCDFWVYLKLKTELKGIQFESRRQSAECYGPVILHSGKAF